jgi:hypothetical protein
MAGLTTTLKVAIFRLHSVSPSLRKPRMRCPSPEVAQAIRDAFTTHTADGSVAEGHV